MWNSNQITDTRCDAKCSELSKTAESGSLSSLPQLPAWRMARWGPLGLWPQLSSDSSTPDPCLPGQPGWGRSLGQWPPPRRLPCSCSLFVWSVVHPLVGLQLPQERATSHTQALCSHCIFLRSQNLHRLIETNVFKGQRRPLRRRSMPAAGSTAGFSTPRLHVPPALDIWRRVEALSRSVPLPLCAAAALHHTSEGPVHPHPLALCVWHWREL